MVSGQPALKFRNFVPNLRKISQNQFSILMVWWTLDNVITYSITIDYHHYLVNIDVLSNATLHMGQMYDVFDNECHNSWSFSSFRVLKDSAQLEHPNVEIATVCDWYRCDLKIDFFSWLKIPSGIWLNNITIIDQWLWTFLGKWCNNGVMKRQLLALVSVSLQVVLDQSPSSYASYNNKIVNFIPDGSK